MFCQGSVCVLFDEAGLPFAIGIRTAFSSVTKSGYPECCSVVLWKSPEVMVIAVPTGPGGEQVVSWDDVVVEWGVFVVVGCCVGVVVAPCVGIGGHSVVVPGGCVEGQGGHAVVVLVGVVVVEQTSGHTVVGQLGVSVDEDDIVVVAAAVV